MKFCLQFLIKQPVQTFFFLFNIQRKENDHTWGPGGKPENAFSFQPDFKAAEFRKAMPSPQYSSGLLECKSRKYESIMFGGTPCKRSLQKDSPPRGQRGEGKSQNHICEKITEKILLPQLPGNVTNYVPITTKIHSVPTWKSSPGLVHLNSKHWASRQKSKFPEDPQQLLSFYCSILV